MTLDSPPTLRPPYLRVRIALVRLGPMKRFDTLLPGFTPTVRILLDPL